MSEKALEIYKNELIRWNKAINLVSPKTIADIDARHIEDSRQLSMFIPKKAIVMDWGSGGGLPAMVLAIIRTDISVHMVESDSKKAEFLCHVSRETKTEVRIHNARIEDVDYTSLKPNIITARALAPLSQLLNWMKLSQNSQLEGLFLKGERWEDEIKEAEKKHKFDYVVHNSQTDKKARIIHIKNLT